MQTERRPFAKFLLDLLADDPEWANYVASLSPTVPLRKAVEDYLRFVKARVALTPEEVAEADRILALMARQGYKTSEEMVDAIEEGAVKLPRTRAIKQPRLEPGGA